MKFTFVCSSRNFYRPQKYVHAHRWDSYKFLFEFQFSNFLSFWLGSHFLQVTLSLFCFFLSRSNKKACCVVGSDVTRKVKMKKWSRTNFQLDWTSGNHYQGWTRSLFFSAGHTLPPSFTTCWILILIFFPLTWQSFKQLLNLHQYVPLSTPNFTKIDHFDWLCLTKWWRITEKSKTLLFF